MKKRIGVLVVIVFLLTIKLFAQEVEYDRLTFPAKPDTSHIVFVTKISSSFDVAKRQSKFNKFFFGEEQSITIERPFGVTTSKGKIYVCDAAKAGIAIINLEQNSFRFFSPEGHGSFSRPVNCITDENGFLYVADGGKKQITIFDQDEDYYGNVPGIENSLPVDLCLYDNKFWVADGGTHEVEVYSSKAPHEHIRSFPGLSKEDEGNLFNPSGIEIYNDTVYISDLGDWSIKVYTKEGEFIRKIGSHGKYYGQFEKIKGLAIDRDGIIHAVDAGFQNVQMFDRNGQILMFYGGSYTGEGTLYLPAGIHIDYKNIEYFKKFLPAELNIQHLIFVTSQYGPDDINIYARIDPTLITKTKKQEEKEKKRRIRIRKRKEKGGLIHF